MKDCALLVFIFTFLVTAVSSAVPACLNAKAKDSIAEATAGVEAICRNANSGQVKQPAQGWFNMCGAGGNIGYAKSWQTIKDYGAMAAHATAAAPAVIYHMNKSALQWEWNKAKGAYNYFFGSDPAAKIDQMAKQDAQVSRSTLQLLKDKYEAAQMIVDAYMTSVEASAVTVFGSYACLPFEWKVHYACFAIQQIAINSVGSIDLVAGTAGKAAKLALARQIASKLLREGDITGKMKSLPLAKSFEAARNVKAGRELERVAQELDSGVSRTGLAERRGVREVISPATLRTRAREDFIGAYEKKTLTDEVQNRAWMAEAKRSSRGESGAVFYDTENSVMKNLNDKVLRDKSLVTSVTNLHKQMMMRELKLLRARNPGLEVLPYSDFKSFRYAFKGKIPRDLAQQIAAADRRANLSFGAELKKLSLVRASDKPETWFKSGLAETADNASSAARVARDLPDGHGLAHFSSPQVQARVESYAKDVSTSRETLNLNPRMAPLLAKESDGTLLPKREVAGLVRKFEDPAQLAEALRTRYGMTQFSKSDAVELKSLYSSAERFSASLHVPKRTVVNLDAAVNGGFSADLRNVGPQNTHDLVTALAAAKTPSEMIAASRASEQKMTELIQRRLEAFKKVVGPTAKCSGDDCIGVSEIVLSVTEKQRLLDKLAADPLTRELRIGFVGPDVTRVADRTLLSTHAELIEKNMRNKLEGVLLPERLDTLTFAVNMDSKAVGSGEVGWIAGTSGQRLSKSEREAVDRALSEAVTGINGDLSKQGVKAAYKASQPH